VLGMAGLLAGRVRLAAAIRTDLPGGLRTSLAAVTAAAAVAVAPPMLLLSALVGHPWPLAFAVAGGVVALLAARRLPG
jgi:hypothetical protein